MVAPLSRQVIIVRRDLLKLAKWNIGSLMAQAVHASVDCLFQFKDDPMVLEYTKIENRSRMTTIVLEAKDENDLLFLKKQLVESKMDFTIWQEQPENIPTAIALKPYLKKDLPSFLSSFKLFDSSSS